MVSIAIATAEAKNTSIKASMYSFTVVSFKESDDAGSCIRRAKFNAVPKARLNARFVTVRHGSELDPTKGNGEKSPLQAGVDNPGRGLSKKAQSDVPQPRPKVPADQLTSGYGDDYGSTAETPSTNRSPTMGSIAAIDGRELPTRSARLGGNVCFRELSLARLAMYIPADAR